MLKDSSQARELARAVIRRTLCGGNIVSLGYFGNDFIRKDNQVFVFVPTNFLFKDLGVVLV
jgi:hypothetical protein